MSEKSIELLERAMALEPEGRRALAELLYVRLNESQVDAEMIELVEARWEEFQKKSPA